MKSTSIANPIFKEASLRRTQVDELPLLMIGTGLDSEIKHHGMFIKIITIFYWNISIQFLYLNSKLTKKFNTHRLLYVILEID